MEIVKSASPWMIVVKVNFQTILDLLKANLFLSCRNWLLPNLLLKTELLIILRQ